MCTRFYRSRLAIACAVAMAVSGYGHSASGELDYDEREDLLEASIDAFLRYDSDRDLAISASEVDTAALLMLSEADANADGMVTRAEYGAIWLVQQSWKLVDEFQQLDADGNLVVTAIEFSQDQDEDLEFDFESLQDALADEDEDEDEDDEDDDDDDEDYGEDEDDGDEDRHDDVDQSDEEGDDRDESGADVSDSDDEASDAFELDLQLDFAGIDLDADDQVTLAEFQSVLSVQLERVIDMEFAESDIDGDGLIGIDEFSLQIQTVATRLSAVQTAATWAQAFGVAR